MVKEMAKNTRSSVATKAPAKKGATKTGVVKQAKPVANGGKSVKVVSKKPAAKAAPAKKVAAKPVAKAPAKKPVAAVSKAAVKKTPAKAAPAKKVAPPKVSKTAASKKPAVGKAPAVTSSKPKAQPAALPSTKAAKTAAVEKSATTKPVAVKAAPPAPPVAAPKPVGKSATATSVAPRTASAVGNRPSSKNEKSAQSRMNSLVSASNDSNVTREDGRYALPATTNVELPKGYRPNADEEYMSPRQLAYFRAKLRDWRDQLVEESRQTMDNLREEVRDVGDEAERATRETENSLELRTRDRYRKLISKIDGALRRIEDGRYGYCEETDEEIGVERLDARPIATLSLDAQERREHLQKQMGD
jgi:DnaK suppressor protein